NSESISGKIKPTYLSASRTRIHTEFSLLTPEFFVVKTNFKERGLNKMQNFILSLASLSFIRRGIEGEVSQGHKLYVI
ncbi:MAG: hypothetical protein ACYT04_75600, partial [Nostoc sp.]